MILLEIDVSGIFAVEFECNAPRSVDMDRVSRRVEAFQRVEVKTGKVQVFWSLRSVKTVQSHKNALLHFGVNLSGFSGLKEARQRFVLERLDHDLCKLFAYVMSREV